MCVCGRGRGEGSGGEGALNQFYSRKTSPLSPGAKDTFSHGETKIRCAGQRKEMLERYEESVNP